MSEFRRATSDQQAKEAAVFYTAGADLAVVVPMFVFGFATMSLTLISEAVRVALMLIVEFYSYFILRAVHRDKLRSFRFGITKLEQFCNLVIGAALFASGFWIANRVIVTIFAGEATATPLGLAVAAVVNGVNTLINALGLAAMLASARSDDSPVFQAQMRARKVKLVASLIVQAAITIAALASDPLIALCFDGLGGAFVAVVQVTIGLRMMSESLPELLDHAVPADLKSRIGKLLAAANVGPGENLRLRTRRAGFLPQIELTLAPAAYTSSEEFHHRVEHIRTTLETGVKNVELGIALETTATDPGS